MKAGGAWGRLGAIVGLGLLLLATVILAAPMRAAGPGAGSEGWPAAQGGQPLHRGGASRDAGALKAAPSSYFGSALPLRLPFPRLGMWWPNTWEQPLDEIARYDWVVFGDWDRENVARIKALNPALMALNASNACELGYDPEPDAPEWANREVRAIPPEWFLTQVGTTLAAGVDAQTTRLRVAAITARQGEEEIALFVPGDTALIEGESVYIEAVERATRTLTVRRGYVRPAAAHRAGARIAAHITFWPHSWLLNVSTLCPRAVVSATIGAETWAEYNARVAAELLRDPIWSGILLDRSDPNESWLIGNSTARSIDADQSNRMPLGYQAFDAAWNEGLRLYEGRLREAVGEGRIIFVNWGMPNYDLLNGNNFEGFPNEAGSAGGSSWQQAVFGPWERGSYQEWLARAQQPNLTMIETYEDDGGPDATGDGSYDNPCAKAGFMPNYRKMRYGLATAMLGDGFYSYEINTNGHGSLCLMWFDEYDNAGQGRGYLGQPLGPARRAIESIPSPNQVPGGMDNQEALDAWSLWADATAGYAATVMLETSTQVTGTGAARIDIAQTQGTDWQVSFSYEPVEVISGTEYTLSFWAKADRKRSIGAWVQQGHAPWEGWLYYDALPLSTTWQFYEVSGVAGGNDPAAQLIFGLGESVGSVWLDEVRLQAGSREVWRRDYAGGVALVNATQVTQTVPLGETLQKIRGKQAPAVNDGSRVHEVSLGPHDGLILLRPGQGPLCLPLILKG